MTAADAEQRLKVHGYNELKGDTQVKWHLVLLSQVANALTVILIIAAALSAYSQEWVEVAVIVVVIVTNTAIGFAQELRSEQTMSALMRMASPTAKVVRNTVVEFIAARMAVPGDVIMLEEGDTVPADARLVECLHMEVDESSLTGESVPAIKTSSDL